MTLTRWREPELTVAAESGAVEQESATGC